MILEFYIWQNAFEFQSPGIASAMVLMVAISGLIFLQVRIRRDDSGGDAEH